MKIYYAHPMSWYGTSREALDVHTLTRTIGVSQVYSPSSKSFEDRVHKAKRSGYPVMQIFADFIRDEVDVVAFRAFDDGQVGAGVAREVFEAIIWNKKVWQIFGKENQPSGPFVNKSLTLSGSGMYPLDLTLDDILTVEQTKERIARGAM